MKKKLLALTGYDHELKAANDDGMDRAGHWTSGSATRPLARNDRGWDPFEVWRTRIQRVSDDRARLKR